MNDIMIAALAFLEEAIRRKRTEMAYEDMKMKYDETQKLLEQYMPKEEKKDESPK